jgi:hypothetical protein
MSPDIHWHVGEDKDQETIAHASAPRRSRRSWIAILIVVMLGVGLGIAYRSIPESVPHPTPVPSPTRAVIPAALYQTIDREAQALADGDFEAYRETWTQATSDVMEVQEQHFKAWGRPSDDRPLYTLVDFDLLTAASAWIDIRQFREGRYFRETRFYYQRDDRWLHGSSDHSLWSGREENLQTPHFDVIYAIEDRDVISPTLRQLEEDYQAFCRDLGCALSGHELTLTLKLKGTEVSYTYPVNPAEEIHLPSPRVMGFFESGRVYSWNDRYAIYAYSALLQAIIGRVHGTLDFDRSGDGLVWAAGIWALNRIDPLPAETLDILSQLQQKPLLSLETLWEIGEVDENGLVFAQLYQFVRFIEQEYSAAAVRRLLGAIDSAKSLSEAVENGLGVPFIEFDQKWQAWAKQNISEQ